MTGPIAVVLPPSDFAGEALVPLERALAVHGLVSIVAALEHGRVEGTGGVRATAALTIEELEAARLAALVVLDDTAGTLAASPPLRELVREVAGAGRAVCGVGRGVAALGAAGVLRRHFVAADGEVADLVRREGAMPLLEPVVVSGNIVTATEAGAGRLIEELVGLRYVQSAPEAPLA
jgi:putative intracellular protease/amidase